MVLQPCPECATQVSSRAAACPRCGCPVDCAPLQAPATTTKEKKPRPAWHIGTVSGCLLLFLATMGITVIGSRSSSPDDLLQQQAAPRRGPAQMPTPPPPSFDANLAAQGKELHARLLTETNVHEFYRAGSLFGAVTREPKASIAVPMDAWKSLGDFERAELMHYAASLVEPMRKDPLIHSQVSASAPAAGMVRENASKMGPWSWVIHGGQLDREGETGSFDILTDVAVASGAERGQRVSDEAQAAAESQRAAEEQRAAQARRIADARAEAFKEALALTGDWGKAQLMLDSVLRSIEGRDDLLVEFMALVDSGSDWAAAQRTVARRTSEGR